jgi:DNA-binding MarR family transcriptional regulator
VVPPAGPVVPTRRRADTAVARPEPRTNDQLLTPTELERWNAWKRASDAVLDRVRREVRLATGLSNADFAVLSIVGAADGAAVRQQRLCDETGWTQSRASNHLSRMERRELVAREVVPGGVLIHPTDEGRALLERARPVHAAAVRRHLLDALDNDAHEAIARLVGALA